MTQRNALFAQGVRILAILSAFFWALVDRDYARACFWLLCAQAIEVKPPRGAS